MSKTIRYPRNEAARRDRIAQKEIVFSQARNHKSRNDMFRSNPYDDTDYAATIALTGTAVAGGVLESEIVTGGETVIITLSNDEWVATIGADNAITTAFLAAITGNLADAAGWNAEVALVHGNLARTSATVLTLTLPATAGYSITTDDEEVTVAPPASSIVQTKGQVPVPVRFTITEGS